MDNSLNDRTPVDLPQEANPLGLNRFIGPAINLAPFKAADLAVAAIKELGILGFPRVEFIPAQPIKLEQRENNDPEKPLSRPQQAAKAINQILDESALPANVKDQYRADLRSMLARRDLPAGQAETVLTRIESLLNHKGDSAVDRKHFANIAIQLLAHIARPGDIDQGHYNTCQIATTQEIMFQRNPARAVEIVTNGAITGSYRASDGNLIKVRQESLVPQKDELQTIPADGARSHASQIFQVLLMNDVTQRRSPPQEYVQAAPDPAIKDDAGERLVQNGKVLIDPRTKQPFIHADIDVDGVVAFVRRTLGNDIVVMPDHDAQHTLARLHKELKDTLMSTRPEAHLDPVVSPTSQAHLTLLLDIARRKNQFPIIARINCQHEDFGAEPSKEPVEHWITIHEYDPAKNSVRVSNQFGKKYDRNVSTAELYKALWNVDWDY